MLRQLSSASWVSRGSEKTPECHAASHKQACDYEQPTWMCPRLRPRYPKSQPESGSARCWGLPADSTKRDVHGPCDDTIRVHSLDHEGSTADVPHAGKDTMSRVREVDEALDIAKDVRDEKRCEGQ
mmetsp:Transcript_8807/g.33229  ORF Transcript_8807/g.33229 Transcript_8807/m.33229 type:complete len:126 (-) Transcript_8807:7580-7957(-)